ncbi:unnamed protein product [Bursaphelenchus xylophilus]|uniref:(pine wood nematode) hypothetical protein n=1 Tax=Bursaphelenchus xylophilus TaxID=6326 RepID=A0A1I7SQF1_BURXY|nr:unnamed protein product [Bursaphelenchus xylophilus]CAG9109811.1 unnamed protein product [Bursaphelenchus xylophilus]
MTRGGEFQDSQSNLSLDPSISEHRSLVDKVFNMTTLKIFTGIFATSLVVGLVLSQSYGHQVSPESLYGPAEALRAQRHEAQPPSAQPASENEIYGKVGPAKFLDVPKRQNSESFAEFDDSHRVMNPGVASAKPTKKASSESLESSESSEKNSCGDLSDTVILLDSTGSLRDLFEAEKAYAEKIVEAHYKKNKKGRLGLVIYSSNRRYKLYGLDDKTDLRAVIRNAPFLSGVTFTGHALKLALTELQKSSSNVNRNLVVITDGYSFDHLEEPLASLRSLNSKPVNIYAVSIGEKFSRLELLKIAGNDKNLFIGAASTAKLISQLFKCPENSKSANKSSANSSSSSSSSESSENSSNSNKNGKVGELGSPKAQKGGNKNGHGGKGGAKNGKNGSSSKNSGCAVDILFLIDVSGSVRKSFDDGKIFAANVVDSLGSNSKLRLGLAKFGAHGTGKVVAEISNRTASDFKSILSKLQNQGSTTYIETAVHSVLEEVRRNGAKGKTLVVIVTDGFIAKFTNEIRDLQSAAKVIAAPPKAGIALYKSELKALASDGLSFEEPESAKKAILNLAQKC